MNTFSFYSQPSEHCKLIYLINNNVYLNNFLLCSNTSLVMISYTILGKRLHMYNQNGKLLFIHFLPISTAEISYYQVENNIYFLTKF